MPDLPPTEPPFARDDNEHDAPPAPTNRRRANRIAAMQFIYQYELNRPEHVRDAMRYFFEHRDHPRDYYAFAEELAWGVIERLGEVDAEIREQAKNWTFGRIAKVDLAILRLAIYELRHRRDIPPIVSINEAIELGKLFSNLDSKRFINGILDKLKGTLDRPLRTAAE